MMTPIPPSDNRAELVLQQLEQLPTLPAVAVRVLEMTGEARANAKDVVKLIESDPSLTARILRIVHRAEGGLRGDVNSVERAVVFLGFEAVRNAVLAVGVFETFGPAASPPSGGRRFDREAFWKHCVAVACMAELIAEAKKQPFSASDAFVAGLLHDIGKVAIDAALPKSFARVIDAVEVLRGDIADIERQVIGIDHHTVGKRLAERWMLPNLFRDPIWLHGQLPAALPESCRHPQLVSVITLADILVRQQHLGFSGNHTFNVPVASLLEVLGLTQAQLDEAAQKLVTRLEPRAKSLGLGEATTEDLYRQAITQANRELGRMTDQLAMKNRKLAVRAKFFEALSGFHEDLRPDSPPATVLFAIAQTATQALDIPIAGAFSLGARGDVAEVMIVRAAGEVVDRGIVEQRQSDRGGAAVGPLPTDGPVARVGPDLEWVTAEFAPKLGGAMLHWIPLKADGTVIGGLIWGAATEEATRLATQSKELTALAGGWSLALRTCQIRDESRALNEQLADANRRLSSAQNEVMRSRTLASIGEMAAGAAHEMNNPLAVISGRSQLLAQQLSDPKQQANAQLVAEQAQRLSDMITELMEFARPTAPRLEACDVKSLAHGGISDAKPRSELADRRVVVTLGDDLPNVRVDASQVKDALAEVLANAAQATVANGRIEVSAAFDRYGGKVVLSIADDGVGMDEHVLGRAFDPFYSAMPAGRRRGMGLAKALRWIEASGGTMRLESKPGEGTRVVIVLQADAGGATATRVEQRIA